MRNWCGDSRRSRSQDRGPRATQHIAGVPTLSQMTCPLGDLPSKNSPLALNPASHASHPHCASTAMAVGGKGWAACDS